MSTLTTTTISKRHAARVASDRTMCRSFRDETRMRSFCALDCAPCHAAFTWISELILSPSTNLVTLLESDVLG
jgi:hypothetical protein